MQVRYSRLQLLFADQGPHTVNDALKPDLMSVVTAHVVYFCAFARSEISEIFQKKKKKTGPGCSKVSY